MLEIDFSGIFKGLDVAKAVPKSQTSSNRRRKQKKKKGKIQNLHVGDPRRLAGLPDSVDEEFLTGYKDTLDALLYPYVAYNQVPLSYAHRYAKAIMDNIFGTDKHLGIFHYLQDKNVEGLTDKDLVNHAEKLLMRGWHIKDEGTKFWLYNGDLQRVIDVTGNGDISLLSESQSFDESNAHLFFEESTASKINAFADRLGYDADALSMTSSLDLLLDKTDNREFFGYLTNYERLRVILSKEYKYRTLLDGFSMQDLYSEGYRISKKLVPSGAVLAKGNEHIIIFPTTDEMNTVHTLNKSLLSQIATDLRTALYEKLPKMNAQRVQALKSLRHVFAYTSELWETDLVSNSYIENKQILDRLDHQVQNKIISEGYKTSVEQALAMAVVTESILLGNYWFNLSSIGLDSLSGNIYVYHTFDSFTRENLTAELEGEASNGVFKYRVTAKDYIEKLPTSYIRALKSLEFPQEEYVQELAGPQDYFENARKFILSEAG